MIPQLRARGRSDRASLATVVIAIAASALLASTGPTRAEDTGISADVESVLDLAIEQAASGRKLAATVTTTVSRTRLTVYGEGKGPRLLDDFPGPLTNERHVVRVDPAKDDAEITVTLGPQGP